MAIVLFLSISSPQAIASEKEELAPGYDECMKKVESFADEVECNIAAKKYQAKRLEENYTRARKLCDKAENPKLCKSELKKLELAWLDFENRVYSYLFNGGIFGPYQYKDYNSDDTIPREQRNAEHFEAVETKRQADRMDLFYRLYERWQ